MVHITRKRKATKEHKRQHILKIEEAAKTVESRIRRLPAETREIVRPLLLAQSELVSAEMTSMRAELDTLRSQLTSRATGDDKVDNSGTNLAIRVVVIPQIDEM